MTRRIRWLSMGLIFTLGSAMGCDGQLGSSFESATLASKAKQEQAGADEASQNQKTTGLVNPIECCSCREECPPVNCPCVDSAMVDLVSVYIKKFRPRGIDNEPGSPWIELDIVPGKYDLMDLKDDLFLKVGAKDIPVGHYSMIRLTMIGQEITFCNNPVAYPFYVAQDNKENIEEKKGIKIFESFWVCPGKHTKVTLKFPEDGLLTWIQDNSTVRLHPKIWVQSIENL